MTTQDGSSKNIAHRCTVCLQAMPDTKGLIVQGDFVCFVCYELLKYDACADLDTCLSCRVFMLASKGRDDGDGFYCDECRDECREEADEISASLAPTYVCDRCGEFVKISGGDWFTIDKFYCSDCLETARKFESLTEAIAIVRAAVKEAYPTTDESAYQVCFGSSGFVTITESLRKEYGREIPHSGYADSEALASDFLHKIKARKEAQEQEPTGWIVSRPYAELTIGNTVAKKYGLSAEYLGLMPVESFVLEDKPKTVAIIPCTLEGARHPIWVREFADPIDVAINAILPDAEITWL